MVESAKSPSPTRRIFGLLMAFLLIASILPLLSFSNQLTVSAQEDYPILIERGPNFQRWDLGDGKFAWESAPQWIFNGSEWVPNIYENRYATDGYYQIQNGLIGARIFDYYTEFYTPDMSEVRVYDERWEVEKWKTAGPGGWDVIGAQSGTPTYSVFEGGNNITIIKTFTSWAGTLEIKYIFREGSAMKHEVVWTSAIEKSTTFRVLQKWAGIVGGRVKHIEGENEIMAATTIDSPFFEFRDENGKITVLELQYSMYYDENGSKLTEHNLKPVEVDTHADGMKADFIFENWTLTQNESLTIDPDTATLDDPTEDGDASYIGKMPDDDDIQMTVYMADTRGYVEWNISSIPGGAAITNTVFKYHGKSHGADGDCHIHEMLGVRPSTSTGEEIYTEAGEGTIYADPDGFPVVGTGQEQDLGTNADSDLQSQLSLDWFAIGIQCDSSGIDSTTYIYSEEYATADPKPTLYVEYTAPAAAPGKPVLVSPENNHSTSDNTPTFTWTVGSGAASHRLVIDNDPAFADGENIYDNTNLGGGATTCTIENQLPPYNYWWKVCAINSYGDNWSENTWTFTSPTCTYVTTYDNVKGTVENFDNQKQMNNGYSMLHEGYMGTPITENRAVDEQDLSDGTNDLLADAQSDDQTGPSPSEVTLEDGWYTVDKDITMHFDSIDTSGISGNITAAMLWVQYSVEDGYGGTNPVEWATDETNFNPTDITPTDADPDDTIKSYNLYSVGVDTISELEALDIRFISNDGAGADAVSFDYVWVEVSWEPPAYQMEIYENVENVPSGENYYLEMEYKLDNANDNFRVQVWNGSTWENRGDNLNSVSWTFWSYQLLDSELTGDGDDVQVKFVDVDNESSPANAILKDYLRVRSTPLVGAPGKPVLVSPENNYSTSDNTPTFVWENGSNATSHRLVIDNSQNFDDGENIYDNASAWDNSGTTIENELPVDNYWWKVAGVANSTENWSENTWTFEIIEEEVGAPKITIPRVFASVYTKGESGTVWAQVLDTNGDPVNAATVTLTVWEPDGDKYLDAVSMGFVTGSNGIYKYAITAPSEFGTFLCDVTATWNGSTAYGCGEFQVASWAENILSILDNLIAHRNAVEATISDIEAYVDTLESGQSTIIGHVDTLESGQSTITGYVDTIETVLGDPTAHGYTDIAHALGVIDNFVDQVEGYTDTLGSGQTTIQDYVDTLEGGQSTMMGYTDAVEGNQQLILDNIDLLKQGQSTIEGYTDTLESGQSTITGYVDQVEGYTDQVEGFVDDIEQYMGVAAMITDTETLYNYLKNTVVPYVDSVETYTDQIEGYVDTLESGQTTIIGHVDTLEGGQATITDYVDTLETGQSAITAKLNWVGDYLENTIKPQLDTIEGYVDSLESWSENIKDNLDLIKTRLGDPSTYGYTNVFEAINTVEEYVDQVEGYTDTLETGQTTIQNFVDTLESGQTNIFDNFTLVLSNQSTIVGYVDQVEGYTDSLEGYCDEVEFYIGVAAMQTDGENLYNYLKNTIVPYVDQVEEYTDQVEGYTDTLEGGQATITDYVDTLETGQTTITAKLNWIMDYLENTIKPQLNTIEGDVDSLESWSENIKDNLDLIKTRLGDPSAYGYVDVFEAIETVENFVDQVEGYTDTLESGQTTIQDYVDTLESGQQNIFDNFVLVLSNQDLIKGYTDDVEGYTDSLEGYCDEVEFYIGVAAMQTDGENLYNYLKNTIVPYVDQVEGYTDQVEGYTDTLEGGQATITDYVDTLESGQTTITAQLNWIADYLENTMKPELDSILDNVQNNYNYLANIIKPQLDNIMENLEASLAQYIEENILATYNYLVDTIKPAIDNTYNQTVTNYNYLTGTIKPQLDNIQENLTATAELPENIMDNIFATYSFLTENVKPELDNVYENVNATYDYLVNTIKAELDKVLRMMVDRYYKVNSNERQEFHVMLTDFTGVNANVDNVVITLEDPNGNVVVDKNLMNNIEVGIYYFGFSTTDRPIGTWTTTIKATRTLSPAQVVTYSGVWELAGVEEVVVVEPEVIGYLTITVLDNQTHNPIENAKIGLYRAGEIVDSKDSRWDGIAWLDITVWGVHDLRWSKDGYESEAMQIDLAVSSELTLKMVPTEKKAQVPPITWILAALIFGGVLVPLVYYGSGKKAKAGSLFISFILPVLLLCLLWFAGMVG